MNQFSSWDWKESFQRFERAAAKGHEESIWILSVVKDVGMEKSAVKEAFTKTEEPLGWCFAGYLSDSGREAFEYYKKSAEGGCSWGQVKYGWCFKRGESVEQDEKVYLEWVVKAASQNNPSAIERLGYWFRYGGGRDKEKAVSYYRTSAELGWKSSMNYLAEMFRYGEGCTKDLRQAAIWCAKCRDSYVFWELLEEARRALEGGATEDFGYDFDQLCYSIGWGLYWYRFDSERWNSQSDKDQAFGNRCLDYYCSCVDQQQKSIFTFLLCWNRTTGRVNGPGQMIAQMVWEGREDNLVKKFEESH
jgi:hypothetical protein